MNAPEPRPHTPDAAPGPVRDARGDDALVLYGQRFASRLLLGTSRYPSPAVLQAAVQRARPAMLTASLRRQTGAAAA